jgi:hypothetical protein
MKYSIVISVLVLLAFATCSPKEQTLSKSYLTIKDYLLEAKIPEIDIIYFYAGKPRMPLPNVYCFDSAGMQLESPPHCFQYVAEYTRLLNDSIVPVKRNAAPIQAFIDSVPIVDSYDRLITRKDLMGYDYYLFIDFIAIPDSAFQRTLFNAKNGIINSKKKVKLFLVHALSEKNAKLFQSQQTLDSTKSK